MTREQDSLSPRELEVLALVAREHTSRRIGELLFISTRTVESHRASINSKLGARSRADVVEYALAHGLLAGD